MASGKTGQITSTIIGGVVSVPVSYVLGRIVQKWGILDPLADKVGEWLKVHVSASAVGWTVSLTVCVILYGLFLWRVWGADRHAAQPASAISAEPVAVPAVASPLPEATPPPPPQRTGPTPYERLLMKRETLATRKERIEAAMQQINERLDIYRRTVDRWSNEIILRPSIFSDGPEARLGGAIMPFRSALLWNDDWDKDIKRPQATIGHRTHDSGQIQPIFDPKENEDYLRKHRANLALLREHQVEAQGLLNKLNQELAATQTQIETYSGGTA